MVEKYAAWPACERQNETGDCDRASNKFTIYSSKEKNMTSERPPAPINLNLTERQRREILQGVIIIYLLTIVTRQKVIPGW